MTEIIWEEPSGGSTRQYKDWAPIVRELKDNPGRWALVATDVAKTTAAFLRTRYGLEAAARGHRDGRVEKLYAPLPRGSRPVTLLERVTRWIVADDALSTLLSEVDEELDAGDEVAVFLYPPVPARRLP